jgi:hypothetical protein
MRISTDRGTTLRDAAGSTSNKELDHSCPTRQVMVARCGRRAAAVGLIRTHAMLCPALIDF